jgi:hypothetical protein
LTWFLAPLNIFAPWSNNATWIIVEFLHKQIKKKAKDVILFANYLALTYEEVNTIDI